MANKKSLIKNFVKAIWDGNAAIFAGAGLSRGSGYVDWKELLRPLAEEINLNINEETDYLAVAQYYQNDHGSRNIINQSIIEAFSKDIELNDNVKILTRLPIYTYWTTNYDRLLEEGLRTANRRADVKTTKTQLANTKYDRDAVLYKMHGDVDDPANAVLTKEDYDRYEINRPLFRAILQGDLISKTFLFIGFSFEDPNLDIILSQLRLMLEENIREHYCLQRRVQKKDYNSIEEYTYKKAKQDLKEQDLKKYGIQTVYVDEFYEISSILRTIEAHVKMRNVFISGSAIEYDPWDLEDSMVLARSLASKLVEKDCKVTTGFGLGLGSAIIGGALDTIYSSQYKRVDEHLTLRPFPHNIEDPSRKAELYTKYRMDMMSDIGIAIFMFGNKRKSSDPTDPEYNELIVSPGCREEYEIAKSMGVKVIPLACTGSFAKVLLEDMKSSGEDISYLQDYLPVLEFSRKPEEVIEAVLDLVDRLGRV